VESRPRSYFPAGFFQIIGIPLFLPEIPPDAGFSRPDQTRRQPRRQAA
jgi:hypothetical protein